MTRLTVLRNRWAVRIKIPCHTTLGQTGVTTTTTAAHGTAPDSLRLAAGSLPFLRQGQDSTFSRSEKEQAADKSSPAPVHELVECQTSATCAVCTVCGDVAWQGVGTIPTENVG